MNDEAPQKNDPFIDQLISVCKDRGYAAELRRFWSPTTQHHSYSPLGLLRVFDGSDSRSHPRVADNAKAITAALYAVNSRHVPGGQSIGSACNRLAGDAGFDAFERHFRRLLASDSLEEVGDQLHRIFKRMDRESITLDYNRVLKDLRNWPKWSESVKTRWAMDFWKTPSDIAAPALP